MRLRVRSAIAVMVLIAAAALPGCATGADVADGADVHPTPLQIELQVATEDGRRLAYRLDRQGVLHFAGGRQVLWGDWRESARLSREQRGRLWRIIEVNDLLEASGPLFASPQRVRYTIELRAGRRRNSFTTVDDRHPALAELAEALDEMHRREADADILRSIEGAMEEDGG